MADTHSLPEDRRTAAYEAMRELERRIVDRIRKGGPDSADSPMLVAAREYYDSARAEQERQKLFLSVPLLAGLSGDIPKPGDVMTFDAAGPDIVIARGRDGKVRAFLNMCMHRGAKVMVGCGARKLLTCRFHGWSYDLEGKLVGLPAENAFEGAASRESVKLVPVPVGEWAGMIFVKAHAGDEQIDVESWLGDMAPNLYHLGLEECQSVRSNQQIDVAANWKYVLNTYGESYHFASLHPTTFSQTAISNTNLYDQFGPHYRVVFAASSYRDLMDVSEASWPRIPYGGSHFVFPNTIIYGAPLPEGGSMIQTYRMFPGSAPSRSVTLMSTYRGGDAPDTVENSALSDMHDFISNVVQTEDYSISEEGQRNLESSPPDHMVVFGRNEVALQNVHRAISDALAS